jgi:histidine ammonia-lyase
MTVVLGGRNLTREHVLRVARSSETVALAPSAIETMTAARAVVERALAREDRVYGLNTAVGVLKRVPVQGELAAGEYSSRMIRQHRVAQGPEAAEDLVRATMLGLANGFASGYPGVRPVLAERLVASLNEGAFPRVRTLGSIGQADLAPMADLAAALFEDVPLGPGEGLALVSSNAFSTAAATLAAADAEALLEAMLAGAALSLEAIVANPGLLHRLIAEARPYPGIRRSIEAFHELLDGSFLWTAGRARSLQDPLSFRNLPQIHGACLDGLEHLDGVLAIELNASQGNPIVALAEDRLISVANYEILPLAAALDGFRILLASAFSAVSERVVKLLETPWSGLPTGLVANDDASDPGLAYLGIACQALASEARLLAPPVSIELVSTSHAEGIEDRATLAPLAARRLADMVGLGRRLVAIELAVAAQATELRGLEPLGTGTAHAFAGVRRVIPFLGPGDIVADVEPLATLVGAGAFGRARLLAAS